VCQNGVMARSPIERFVIKFRIDEQSGCWLWTDYVDPQNGYGRFRMKVTTLAHRAAWELLRGPIPKGAYIDHRCRQKSCVNPEHLEPVTPQMNSDRGPAARRLYCVKKGHPMTPENTGNRTDGRRYCRTCHQEYARVKRAPSKPRKADPGREARWQAFCETNGLNPATGQDR